GDVGAGGRERFSGVGRILDQREAHLTGAVEEIEVVDDGPCVVRQDRVDYRRLVSAVHLATFAAGSSDAVAGDRRALDGRGTLVCPHTTALVVTSVGSRGVVRDRRILDRQGIWAPHVDTAAIPAGGVAGDS